MMIADRYDRNRSCISQEQQEKLKAARVLILGCGGIGGYVIEYLARIGVGNLTLVDGDAFQGSNLNRQLYSREDNLGMGKAQQAMERVGRINSEINVKHYQLMADENNLPELIQGQDVVIDALDSARCKLLASKICGRMKVPFIHGAISGWCTRVYTAMPGDDFMQVLCAGGQGTEKQCGNLSFTAANCASIQASEAVKLILGENVPSAGSIIESDLLTMEFNTIEIG